MPSAVEPGEEVGVVDGLRDRDLEPRVVARHQLGGVERQAVRRGPVDVLADLAPRPCSRAPRRCCPVVSVWHVQGMTVKFCWQPRNSWSQVWFTHRNWFLFQRKDWVSGSVSEARPALNTIWRRNPCAFCQETSGVHVGGDHAVGDLGVDAVAQRVAGQSSPGVQWWTLSHMASLLKMSSTCTVR